MRRLAGLLDPVHTIPPKTSPVPVGAIHISGGDMILMRARALPSRRLSQPADPANPAATGPPSASEAKPAPTAACVSPPWPLARR
jgi:hypothetical protein